MNDTITVVIRNKNQAESLDFLLTNLKKRYSEDIDEIIVLDNRSSDNSLQIIEKQGVKKVTIDQFSYGGSANLAAESARNDLIVIFSAHAFPVSHDFFKLIKISFLKNSNLAGLRCLHNGNDYKHYINEVSSKENPNEAGVIFCGSAFNKKVWEKFKFKDDIQTMEDKEWSQRVLHQGYDIEFVPAIFCYDIKRTDEQLFFRYKNEVIGSYQLWHTDYKFTTALKMVAGSTINACRVFSSSMYYTFKRFCFLVKFIHNKPEKF
ncbi:glycosyltransferase involved in cell wall biosynthesis [Flavobacterium sp. CG_9.10]|uniref:glycosyltransferase n=1 Tax=Flavobacterium sp. CG_9.10 TaxID=2787729 RepID=UPI0018C9ACA8|nr:glycosyltransferase [Flavobacterium sp. CG_9.10]MBG6109800.1 glycosyltransferase involved in cell wall biosynthesis [Flavobacterium sp. CG_9.10]